MVIRKGEERGEKWKERGKEIKVGRKFNFERRVLSRLFVFPLNFQDENSSRCRSNYEVVRFTTVGGTFAMLLLSAA